MITKEDLIEATKERRLHVVKNFYNKFPSWLDVDSLYDLLKNTEPQHVEYNSFSTMVIMDKFKILNFYNDIVKTFSEIHNGDIQFVMLIISFINRNNNVIDDSDCLRLAEKYYLDNPKKIPQELTINKYSIEGWPNSYWDPPIHFDEEDRVFIQGSGQTLWKIFDENNVLTDEIILSSGDLAYIPTRLRHCVESLCARHSVSIALSEDNQISQML
jgi:hypothetical protein